MRGIKHARRVQIVPGGGKGMIPHDEFGHSWFEYIGLDVWADVFETFLDDESSYAVKPRSAPVAKL